ncbi:unnamed protein product [Ostreobium quekettii]|uniref:Uncharacterized protein n=1 Tax=Ostreobium quekettii TaxID=121088 RepID=A0A8S1IYF1_9CHLO|nr:unnamed protein product [Ostreobium quekettii]
MASLLVLIVVLVSSVGHLGTARREGPSDGKSLTSFEFSEGTLQQGNPLEFQHHRQLEQDAPSANATDTQAADKEAKKLAKKLGKKLWKAASEGNVKKVQKLIGRGASLKVRRGELKDTPLMISSANGHLEVVETLIDAGAGVNASDRDRRTALYKASFAGHLPIAEALLAAGAAVNKAKDARITPLWAAAHEGHAQVVNALLQAGALVDKATLEEVTPLWAAAQNGHVDVTELLLEAGADPNKTKNTGASPLLVASQNGHAPVVDALLEAGADPEAANAEGIAPLHSASVTIGNASVAVVGSLLDANATIDKPDNLGWTPLIWASSHGNLGTVGLLVERGANVTAVAVDGKTAADLVCECLNSEGDSSRAQCTPGGCELPQTSDRITELLK